MDTARSPSAPFSAVRIGREDVIVLCPIPHFSPLVCAVNVRNEILCCYRHDPDRFLKLRDSLPKDCGSCKEMLRSHEGIQNNPLFILYLFRDE
jgi:hypothetical protein